MNSNCRQHLAAIVFFLLLAVNAAVFTCPAFVKFAVMAKSSGTFLRTGSLFLRPTLAVVLLMPFAGMLSAQPVLPGSFDAHMRDAHTYSEASMYGSAMEELNAAIETAKQHKQEKQQLTAAIALGELMRKTGDFEKGIALLHTLGKAAAYPELQVKRLDRMAAIYAEWQAPKNVNRTDSVKIYLDSALHLSEQVKLPAQEASIYNQLGYHTTAFDREKGLQYLQKSATLFLAHNDTHNYVGARTNMLRTYLAANDSLRSGEIIRELVPLVKNRKWYTAEIELYRLAASYAHQFYKNAAAMRQWESLADQRLIANLEAVNTAQVNAFRTLYETRKLQDELAARQLSLDREARRTRELILFAVLLAVLVVIVLLLLLRERRLRMQLKKINADLEKSTEKYRLLMVESNHRIKNNLQMIISMLHYGEPGGNPETGEAFQRMAQKIQTIGALHLHLSADAHNELVPMDAYFETIAGIYRDIVPDLPPLRCEVVPVAVPSERMVYFGLILNEMLANTVAHGAVPPGGIVVQVKAAGDAYCFDYRDGSAHQAGATSGTGTRLIRQLIERVGGTGFHFEHLNGHYQFLFHG